MLKLAAKDFAKSFVKAAQAAQGEFTCALTGGSAANTLYPLLARNRYRLPLAPMAWVLEQGLQCTVRRQARQAAARSEACARGSDACDIDRPR